MLRPIYAIILSASLLCGCHVGEQQVSPYDANLPFRPNILWLVAEDLSPILPMYGDSTVETPNLSRLADEGIVYTHFFSPSGVCAPSRAAIATGMYPTRIGAHHMRTSGFGPYMPVGIVPYECVPPEYVTMHSQYLREEGYYCTNNAKEDYQFKPAITAWDESSNQAHWRNRQAGQPFFAIFNFGVTHESQVWGKANDSLWVDEDLEVPVPPYLPDNEVGRRDIRQVYSNIKTMDAQVGEILAQLEDDGLLDSTIIFWYGDHGGPLPRQKRLMYDAGIQLPMVVRFPNGWKAGTRDDRMLSFIDLLPTLVSLSGEAPPRHTDGKAFLGPFAEEIPRDTVFAASDRFDELHDMKRAVRTRDFKYIRNVYPEKPMYLPISYRENMPVMQELLRMRDAGELTKEQALWFRERKPEEELYDLAKDPFELNNLAEEPAYEEQLLALRVACDRWMDLTDDKGLIPEEEMLLDMWPGKEQPVTDTPVVEVQGEGARLRPGADGGSVGYVLLEPEDRVEWIVTPTRWGNDERYMLVTASDTTRIRWSLAGDSFPIPEGKKAAVVGHRIGYRPSEVVYTY